MSSIRSKRRTVTVYVNDELREALAMYRAAGVEINLSRTVQRTLVDWFIRIEKARRLTGEPFLYTPMQLAKMKADLEDD